MIEKYEGWILAKSTIHHGGNEKTGSTPVLRTIFLYVEGRGEIPFPYINGNSIRGKLRRLLMRDFFEKINFSPENLDTKVYHTFFTGGALEATEGTYAIVDLPLRRKIRNLFIPLGLLGCAIGNQMIPGKLKVGHAFPICEEYSKFLPETFHDERIKMPVRIFTDETFNTRRDDLHAVREEDEQAVQMRIDFECFIPGTKFYHWFLLEYPTSLERSCFGRFMEIFKEYPFLGGKSGIGNGEVILSYAPELPSSKEYLDFIEMKKDEIHELVAEISKDLNKPKKTKIQKKSKVEEK